MWFHMEWSVNPLVPAVQWCKDEYFIRQRIARSGTRGLSEFAISYGRHDVQRYMILAEGYMLSFCQVSYRLHVRHGYTLTDTWCRPNFIDLYLKTICYDMDAATLQQAFSITSNLLHIYDEEYLYFQWRVCFK